MSNAYCNECGMRVMLADDGGCVNGHARSALRDVREGALVDATNTAPRVVRPAIAPRSAVPSAAETTHGSPNLPPKQAAVSKAIGIVIIAVPAAIVVIAFMWSSYVGSVAFGMTKSGAWWSSVGSLILTGGLVALWSTKRRKPKK